MLILLPAVGVQDGPRPRRSVVHDTSPSPSSAPTRSPSPKPLAQVSAHPDAAAPARRQPQPHGRDRPQPRARTPRRRCPPSRVYSGVLYDALGYATLDTAAQAPRQPLAGRRLGPLRRGAPHRPRSPPYRLSMAVNLPGVGPLASAWKPELDRVLPAVAGRGRRGRLPLAARMPRRGRPGATSPTRWVQVRVPGATHMAKHTRGLVARSCARSGRDVRSGAASSSTSLGRRLRRDASSEPTKAGPTLGHRRHVHGRDPAPRMTVAELGDA